MSESFVDQSIRVDHKEVVDEESRANRLVYSREVLPGSHIICDDHSLPEDHLRSVVAECGADQTVGEAQQSGVDPATNSNSVGHLFLANQQGHADADRIGHQAPDARVASVDPVLIATIQEQWRRRRAWHRAEKSLTLQAKALCRRLAYEGDKKEADVIYAAATGKGEHPRAETALAAMLPLVTARDQIEKSRKDVEKRLGKLAAELPVAAFVIGTRGVALPSLAAIVGEAGDLSNYANPAKLWKRMGLAVMPDGGRQRRVTGDAAIMHGYNAERRSVMWNIGACIIKAGGPLKEIYNERKEYELARLEKKGHAHNRAQRYVEKRFLKLLWSEWRRQAISALEPGHDLPAANNSADEQSVERQAKTVEQPDESVPAA